MIIGKKLILCFTNIPLPLLNNESDPARNDVTEGVSPFFQDGDCFGKSRHFDRQDSAVDSHPFDDC